MMWSSAGISHIRPRDQYISLNQVDGLQRKKGENPAKLLKLEGCYSQSPFREDFEEQSKKS